MLSFSPRESRTVREEKATCIPECARPLVLFIRSPLSRRQLLDVTVVPCFPTHGAEPTMNCANHSDRSTARSYLVSQGEVGTGDAVAKQPIVIGAWLGSRVGNVDVWEWLSLGLAQPTPGRKPRGRNSCIGLVSSCIDSPNEFVQSAAAID